MHLDQHYVDRRVTATYDTECAARHDIDFYLALARELGAGAVIDLACGTGVLAVELAEQGVRVVGVDPAAAMLEVARHRPGGDRVTWINGDSSVMSTASADLILMTGHAAQVFLTDDDWAAVLADCARALRPGGQLAFETRNPLARGWSSWNRADSHGSYERPEPFQSWVEVTDERPGFVTFIGHTVFATDGLDVTSTSTLRFRTRSEVENGLHGAGFVVREVFGDWRRRPVTEAAPELIFVATGQ